MIFSVSNDGIERSLDFGPDSVTLTVKVLVQDMTMSSQKIPLAAWSLLLSQRQQFLNNLLARVPVTPNQQVTHEMKDEVLSSVGARDMDTSGYQVSSADLDDVEFFLGKRSTGCGRCFQTSIDSPFSPTPFDDLEMEEVQQKTPLCSTKRKTRRTPLLQQQQPFYERPTRPLHC